MIGPEVINETTKHMVMYHEHVSLKHALFLEHLRSCNWLFVVPGSRQKFYSPTTCGTPHKNILSEYPAVNFWPGLLM
jgi:hypothetical protein